MTTELAKFEETPSKEVALSEFRDGVDTLPAKRDYFIRQVLPKLKENQDYFTIKGKKSLAKGGAEKLASIYNLIATFAEDKETREMLKDVRGLVCYVCTLTRHGEIVGQGRGADTLDRNQNDPNKTVKMAQKRSYVDAVIRATGLSDLFSQDLEDMEKTPKPQPQAGERITPQQVKLIYARLKIAGISEPDFVAHFQIRAIPELPKSRINEALEAIAEGLITGAGQEPEEAFE